MNIYIYIINIVIHIQVVCLLSWHVHFGAILTDHLRSAQTSAQTTWPLIHFLPIEKDLT